MSDDELKFNRRIFLQYSAVATAATGTWYSVAMKTDALAQETPDLRGPGDENIVIPYQYGAF